jgi:prepilin-type N-terminal cleavage/methylation domain-containing protein
MNMKRIKRTSGFTLIEVMVVIGIIGILGALAMPTYRTWQYRAYGTEASIMAKQILDAQIVYFLENNRFYPDNDILEIYHNDPSDDNDILAVKNNINIVIPSGHLLNYTLAGANAAGGETFNLTIASSGGFDIVKGSSLIQYQLDRNGNITNLNP